MEGRPRPGGGDGRLGEGLEFPEGGQAAVGLPEDLLQGQDPLLEGLALGSQQGLVGRRGFSWSMVWPSWARGMPMARA